MRKRLLPKEEGAPIVRLVKRLKGREREIPFDVNERREKGACRLSRRGTFLVLWKGGIRGYLLFCSLGNVGKSSGIV